MILKLISFLFIAYLIFKVVGNFFRILTGTNVGNNGRTTRPYSNQGARGGGNVKVDYIPNQKKGNYDNADDIDYEEVK